MAPGTTPRATFGWSDASIELVIDVDEADTARITRLAAPPFAGATTAGLPLVDLVLAGEGRAWSGRRYCESTAGPRLRYQGHVDTDAGDGWHEIRVDLADPVTGVRAEVFYRVLRGHGTVRAWVRLTNDGAATVTVESVTSFLCGAPAGDGLTGLDVLWCENDWLAEGRWQRRGLRDALPDLNRDAHGADSRGRFGITSLGTWSSGTYLPMGAVVDERGGHAWAWQIEHNGAWHWQVGEHTRGADRPHAYVALLGPTDAEHHWDVALAPGESFTTVPVAVAVAGGFEEAVGRMTAYRRAVRRPHEDHRHLPVIFNDYMNTLSGDPTTDKLLPLVAAAADAGAEYFVIDAGWYSELDTGWWDTVGAWKPSTTRFPDGGLAAVLDRIREAGMVPGLWLEPEVVGVRSPVADRLPDAAFFVRRGRRVVENGRYHLDLRHPAAVKHLDEVIDHLVGDLGVGYLKLDYNINGGPGTDAGGLSAGAGLLAHNRAHLDWLDAVLDRHPALVVENCSSGGMRTDYALLSRLHLQSTSDQQDFLRYPPISAAAFAAVPPEQAAAWAYPQPAFSDHEIVFALCSALLGRVHLSGHLDAMSDAQRRLVADAVAAYKGIRSDLAEAVPFWPLGLPGWDDSVLAVGMRAPKVSYLVVWARAGEATEVALPVAGAPTVLYPRDTAVRRDAERGVVVSLPPAPSACLIRLD